MPEIQKLARLKDLWDEQQAHSLAASPLALLRYRSNLLGKDLRITNFGGGNTSSKFDLKDPFSGESVRVLAVKGSGGDIGSITEPGFAILYLDRLEQLKSLYGGEAREDEMVSYYPLSAFGQNRVAASIDTPLHAFLPFPHVDHLHPDWAIALAASANGNRRLEEFNEEFGRKIVWVPWQRPGFELALLIEKAVRQNLGTDGLVLGGHGLFTWGTTQRECYLNSIFTIDQMGEFISRHRKPRAFGGARRADIDNRQTVAMQILPALRGAVSSNRRVIAHFTDSEDALTFAGSQWAKELCALGTSCPDHFLRTRVCPLFLDWDPSEHNVQPLKASIHPQVAEYRAAYKRYYEAWATADSPGIRDSNPSVVVVPGLGLFGFGKNKKEARITTEFFINAIHVMEGANTLESANVEQPLPQARLPEQSTHFTQFHNYVALPRSEAFRIEYWALEDAKLQRMPAEAEFSRKIGVIIGSASGIGREVALLLARRGAHLVVADFDEAGAKKVAEQIGTVAVASPEFVSFTGVDLSSADSLAAAIRKTILEFGGIDFIVNTAAIYPVPGPDGELSEAQWAKTFLINVTGNYLLANSVQWVLEDQNLPASMILTGSANAVVPKKGSEAYDTSKAALNHLIRELAIKLGPLGRVNGIAPATVVGGSTMFPRDRVIQSLEKYKITYSPSESDEELRDKLARFYAQRTLLKQPITPEACAEAIVWLLGEQSTRTTGHVIPVDGGLTEAFLR